MTGRAAAPTRPVDTEPKSWPRNGPRPRVPTTARHTRRWRAAPASASTGSPSTTCMRTDPATRLTERTVRPACVSRKLPIKPRLMGGETADRRRRGRGQRRRAADGRAHADRLGRQDHGHRATAPGATRLAPARTSTGPRRTPTSAWRPYSVSSTEPAGRRADASGRTTPCWPSRRPSREFGPDDLLIALRRADRA